MRGKYLIVQGELWAFHSFFKIFEIFDVNYLSFYEPIYKKNSISKKKIYTFHEKYKSPLLWFVKIFLRNYKLFRLIKKNNYKYIVTHHDDANVSVLPTLLIFKYLLKKDIKFIAYIHNGNISHQDNFLLKFIIPFFIKNLYRHFDKIITVSNGNKKYLENDFKLKNIEVIYNPIDIDKYLSQSLEKLDVHKNLFEKNSFKFLTIGRLTLQKNLINLIDVFSSLNSLNFKLYIIGEGELRDILEKKIKENNLENKIFLLGFNKNVFKYIKKCDCFLLNSYWESFGQVLVEALIFNKIVISTDCQSGPREIISPELSLDEKIKYPYFGKYGILTRPYILNNNRDNADNCDNTDNSNNDKIVGVDISDDASISNTVLKNLLIEVINNDKNYFKKYSNGISRSKVFDVENIEKQLVNVLK